MDRHRASSGERRLAREVRRLEAALDEAHADSEARVKAAEERTGLAEAKADAARMELDLMAEAVERMRAHYRADIAEAARRIARDT